LYLEQPILSPDDLKLIINCSANDWKVWTLNPRNLNLVLFIMFLLFLV
jgi:hypothetical protein